MDPRGLIIVLSVVAYVRSEMPNPNTLLWIKFCGLNSLFRRGLVGVIPEILKLITSTFCISVTLCSFYSTSF